MNTTSFYRIAVASTVSALTLAFATSAVPAQASSAIDVQDWAVFVDPPTRFGFVKTPNGWVFVRQLDEQQMTRLPAGTLFALLKEDDSEIRYAHPALEPHHRIKSLHASQWLACSLSSQANARTASFNPLATP